MKYSLWRQVRRLLTNRSNVHAFILAQLLITCALIAFLALLSLSSLHLIKHQSVAADAYTLRAACWYLQLHARTTQREQSLVFDEAGLRYISSTGDVHRLAHGVLFGVLPGVLGPPADPRALLTRAITFMNNKIIFYPTGAVQPGSVYLVDKNQQVLYAVTVAVAGASYFRIYKYDQTRWQLCA